MSDEEKIDKIHLGEKPSDTESAEEILGKVNEIKKARWLHIFVELSKSQRFLDFVENNFVIQDAIDQATRTIDTIVIEKPVAVGPKLTGNQIFKLQGMLASYGVKNTVDCMKAVLNALGQEASPIITASEPLKLVSLDDIKKKLD